MQLARFERVARSESGGAGDGQVLHLGQPVPGTSMRVRAEHVCPEFM